MELTQTETAPAGLPPAIVEPLPEAEALLAKMPSRPASLLLRQIEGRGLFMLVRTDTKVDVGSWLGKGRVWMAVLDDSLAVAASAPGCKQPLAEMIPFSRLRRSRYNHVTGQLALAPAGIAGTKGLAMSPVEAGQVLAQIYHTR